MEVYAKDCKATGRDPKVIQKLARRLERVAEEINAMGLELFGAEGSALYIIDPRKDNPLSVSGRYGIGSPYVLADIKQRANGGIMQSVEMEDGTHALCG